MFENLKVCNCRVTISLIKNLPQYIIGFVFLVFSKIKSWLLKLLKWKWILFVTFTSVHCRIFSYHLSQLMLFKIILFFPSAGLDIGPISDDPSTSLPLQNVIQSARPLSEEQLDGILSPELDKMVTDGKWLYLQQASLLFFFWHITRYFDVMLEVLEINVLQLSECSDWWLVIFIAFTLCRCNSW